MLQRLLYAVAEVIVGKNGQAIVDLLKDKKDVNEFKIADKLKMTINQARNILYKLYAQDIVSFIRKKDKGKGWYIYYWTLNSLKTVELFMKIKEKEMHDQQALLKSKENKRFYQCKGCAVEMTEETALHHDFSCPECGNLLELSDNSDKIKEIVKRISKIEQEMKTAEHELVFLREEVEKKKRRVAKKEAKKKAKEKASKKKAKKAEKKKEERLKKNPKKKKALKRKK
jgi:transcription initiation factor TFIIE subunit alpha